MQVASDQVFSAFNEPVVSLGVSGPWIRERFCKKYECNTLGAEAVRQWTFVLPGVELAADVLVFLGSNRSGVVETTWVSLADDADYGPASKNSQLVGMTLDDWDKNAKLEAFNCGITNFDTFVGGLEFDGIAALRCCRGRCIGDQRSRQNVRNLETSETVAR